VHKSFGPLFAPALADDAKAFFKDRVMGKLKYIDSQLAGRDYLMGKQFTVADGYLFTMLTWGDRMKFDLSAMPNRDAGKQLWERTDLKPSDVQMAQLYDGFSWLTMSWLEALQLCGVGESGPFIEGGSRIARDGQLPLNTHGGQLSAGRLHGYGFLHEGATQMWGRAGDRQIPTPPEVGVIGAGGGNTCGCLLLVRE